MFRQGIAALAPEAQVVWIDKQVEALMERIADLEWRLEWYAERRNYAPTGGESSYDHLVAVDGYDGLGPGARARAALTTGSNTGSEPK